MKRAGRRLVADPHDGAAAFQAAIASLERQPQTRAGLGLRLRRTGYAEETIGEALDRVERLGYLNDVAYAEALVRRRSRTRGPGLIRQELRAKGVSASTMDRVMQEIGVDAERQAALTLARDVLRRNPSADPREIRRRVGGALSRRGFDARLVYRICNELVEAQPFDTPCEVD